MVRGQLVVRPCVTVATVVCVASGWANHHITRLLRGSQLRCVYMHVATGVGPSCASWLLAACAHCCKIQQLLASKLGAAGTCEVGASREHTGLGAKLGTACTSTGVLWRVRAVV